MVNVERADTAQPSVFLADRDEGRAAGDEVILVPGVAQNSDALLEHGVVCDHAIARDWASYRDAHSMCMPVKALSLCR